MLPPTTDGRPPVAEFAPLRPKPLDRGLMEVMLAEHTENAHLDVSLRVLHPAEFTIRADDLIDIYVAAMRYPPGSAAGRRNLWQEHSWRAGFGCIAAFGADGLPLAFCYGYTGQDGQWWHNEVRRGLTYQACAEWLDRYVELTELHVRPDCQGRGLGEQVLRRFLDARSERRVLLSTPEGENRAWRLYRRLGFQDVLRQHRFTGDPRPFGILGRRLPIDS